MRPLKAQDDEDAHAQGAHDRLDFGDDSLGRADDHLHVLLPAHQRRVKLAPDFRVIDLGCRSTLHLFLHLLAADPSHALGWVFAKVRIAAFELYSGGIMDFVPEDGICPPTETNPAAACCALSSVSPKALP